MSSFPPPCSALAQPGGDRDALFTVRRGGAGTALGVPIQDWGVVSDLDSRANTAPSLATQGSDAGGPIWTDSRFSGHAPSLLGTYTGRASSRHTRASSRHTEIVPSSTRTTVRAPAAAGILGANRRNAGSGQLVRLTPSARVPTMVGRATPSSWSPFLRVGARTLRTEQCAKSQCVYPVDIGRCGSPYLSARRSYGNCNTGRPIRVCCSGRPTFQQRTRNRPSRPGPTVLLRRV